MTHVSNPTSHARLDAHKIVSVCFLWKTRGSTVTHPFSVASRDVHSPMMCTTSAFTAAVARSKAADASVTADR